MADERVSQCQDCPLFNTSDVCETCRHPAVDRRRISYEEMETIPQWCPLRKGSLTVALALSKVDDHG